MKYEPQWTMLGIVLFTILFPLGLCMYHDRRGKSNKIPKGWTVVDTSHD